MSAQPDMFATPMRRIETPAFRATDPSSSEVAASEHTASGQRQTNLEKIVAQIRLTPGMTSAELALLTKLDRTEAGRRTSDADGVHAVQGPQRLCRANPNPAKRRKAVTWWPK